MEDPVEFLKKTKELRDALKQKALDIEYGITRTESCSILESRIEQNIQSSVSYCKTSQFRMSSLDITKMKSSLYNSSNNKNLKSKKKQDPLRLPEVRQCYLPYLKKPSNLPLPVSKKIKKYKVNFTGIEPKLKKLKQAYNSLTDRNL